MFDLLKLQVLSMSHSFHEVDAVAWVQVHLADGGSIGIFPGHTPLIAETISAPLRYAVGDNVHNLTLEAGILMVEKGKVIVLVEEAHDNSTHESIADIDIRSLLQKLRTVTRLDEILAEGTNGRE